MRKRAKELGFVPATPQDLDFLTVAEVPASEPISPSPTSFLYTGQGVSLSPAYRETLLEWILRSIRPTGGK